MKVYESSFIRGRELAKKLVIGAVISCVASVIASQTGSNVQFICVAVSLVMFCSTIYVIIKYCRCPHCGKIIFLGVLQIKTCPACKRDLVTGKKAKKK